MDFSWLEDIPFGLISLGALFVFYMIFLSKSKQMHEYSIKELAKVLELDYSTDKTFQHAFGVYNFQLLPREKEYVLQYILSGKSQGAVFKVFEVIPSVISYHYDEKSILCIMMENLSWDIPDMVLEPKKAKYSLQPSLKIPLVELNKENEKLADTYHVMGTEEEDINNILQRWEKPLLKQRVIMEIQRNRLLIFKFDTIESVQLERYIRQCVDMGISLQKLSK